MNHGASDLPRVLYLAAGYYRPGGVEVYLLHYATELRKQGFQTRIVVFDALPVKPHWCMRALQDRGISLESLEERISLVARILAVASYVPWVVKRLLNVRCKTLDGNNRWPEGRFAFRISPLTSYWTKHLAVRELRRMIAREKPDIIHVKGRIVTEALAVLPPERTIFHIATSGARDESWENTEVEAFRGICEKIARIFAPGTGVAERFKREFGIQREVIPVFTMAPDEAAKCVDAGPVNSGTKIRFGYLGRFAHGKGIPQILSALKTLGSAGRWPAFTFAGEGPLEELILAVARDDNLQNVTVIKVTSPAEALAAMDVVVLPSESEAMPLVLVEALMCGRPCLATRVGGVPDLIRDGREGILIDDTGPERIVEGMNRFMAMTESDLVQFSRNARNRYEERCQPERVAVMVADQYRTLLVDMGY